MSEKLKIDNYEKAIKEILRQNKEIERLNSIIKEVREYIEKMEKLHFDYSYEKQELLEILDGVDKENK